jgi:hypothetical protein
MTEEEKKQNKMHFNQLVFGLIAQRQSKSPVTSDSM